MVQLVLLIESLNAKIIGITELFDSSTDLLFETLVHDHSCSLSSTFTFGHSLFHGL